MRKPRGPGTAPGAMKRKAERLVNDAIKKLEPYEPHLTQVALRSAKISRLRGELNGELAARRVDLCAARSSGAPRELLASAAGVSQVRVSQIMAGGAK